MLYVLQMIKTMSQESNEVCKRINDNRLHDDMLKVLRWEAVNRQSRSKILFVTNVLLTLQYVVRRVETARVAFRECHAVDVLQKFRDIYTNQVIS